MAVARINLGQPLEAHADLERAIRYGAAPLDADKYLQAINYKKLLVGQLAAIKIICREPGAAVTLRWAEDL